MNNRASNAIPMNCFLYTTPEALALRWLFPFSDRFAANYQIHVPWSFCAASFEHHLKQLQASECKLLICHHPGGLNLSDERLRLYEDLLSKIAETGKVFTLPTFAFDGFWPFLVEDTRPCMHVAEGGALPSFRFGDDFILSRLTHEMPCREAARQYIEADVAELVDLEDRLASALRKLKVIEAGADVKVGRFVAENIKAARMFASPNQPGNALSLEIANQILRMLGFDEINAELRERLLPLVRRELPVHPSVGAFHGLDHASVTTRYLVDKHNRMTFAEYMRAYACLDPNVLLDHAG